MRDGWRPICVGALAGLLSGMFGVGGGILIVPGLVLIAAMSQRLAHGTSLAAIIPVAGAGVAGYVVSNEVDVVAAGCITLGAMGGAVVGADLLRRASPGVLRLAFAGLLLATAVRMLVDSGDAPGRDDLTVFLALGLVALGLASGILAGLFGVGGGIVLVPAMIVLFGMADPVAKGTSLLVIIPTSLIGTWRNRRNDNTDLHVALVVGVSGVVTAFLGARVSLGMSDSTSSGLFAILLVVVAARLLLTHYRARART